MRWITDCAASSTRLPEASYSVRPFVGLVITATQLPQQERYELQKVIEANGGTYEANLDLDRCTHLVAVAPEGDKFESVKYSKTVRVMRREWIHACVNQQGDILIIS